MIIEEIILIELLFNIACFERYLTWL